MSAEHLGVQCIEDDERKTNGAQALLSSRIIAPRRPGSGGLWLDESFGMGQRDALARIGDHSGMLLARPRRTSQQVWMHAGMSPRGCTRGGVMVKPADTREGKQADTKTWVGEGEERVGFRVRGV